MFGAKPGSGAVRVTTAGMTWLRRAAAEPTPQGASRPLMARAGVVFDVLDMPRPTGETVFAWLCANRRLIGPIALDADIAATRWLIPIEGEADPQSRRLDLVLPQEPGLRIHRAGTTLRLPAQVTAAESRLRWVVRPDGSEPLLTSVADLAEALVAVRSARRLLGEIRRSPARQGCRRTKSPQPPTDFPVWAEAVGGLPS